LPLSWLLEAASPPIQYRAYAEILPESARDPERLAALREALLAYKIPREILRKQKATGLWGTNLLGPGPSKAHGWSEVGTVYQYRRLLELGWPPEDRAFRLADRWLFQILSRIEPDDADRDAAQRAIELLVEFQKPGKADLGLARWARRMGREGAACALARGGHGEDPRLRGSAHRIVSDISQFLRSELAEKPFKKAHGKTVLDPAATPPTIFAVEMLAFLPSLQRARAGFVERLGRYFSSPAPRRAFYILAGKKLLKPVFELLGDPMRADAQGHIRDVPLAVYWIELLARLGLVRQTPAPRGCWPVCSASATTRASGAPRAYAPSPSPRRPSLPTTSPWKGRERVRRSARPTSPFGSP